MLKICYEHIKNKNIYYKNIFCIILIPIHTPIVLIAFKIHTMKIINS